MLRVVDYDLMLCFIFRSSCVDYDLSNAEEVLAALIHSRSSWVHQVKTKTRPLEDSFVGRARRSTRSIRRSSKISIFFFCIFIF